MSIATEKTIASYRSGADIFKFFDLGTKLVEAETGYSVNEPVNYAVRAAIEQGVIEMVHEGEHSGLWKFKDVTYTGKLPEVRPLVLEEALKKWPDARLNCSADDLCVPTKDDE
jgi:predicted TIM-barrel fold metal-dependent hydrolase